MPASGLVFPKDDAHYTFEKSRFPSLSYNTLLGSNGTYTQPWVDSANTMFVWSGRTDFLQGTAGPQDVNFVSGSVYADQAGTVYIDQSDDQVNYLSTAIAVSASTLTQIQVMQISSRYYRFRYVNGATGQGTFVLTQISERIDALKPKANPVQIAVIPFGSFAANTTFTGRYNAVLARSAQARTFEVVNKLNQSSNGNVYLVGYDSMFPKPTFSYAGSQSLGTIGSNSVGVAAGSVISSISSSPMPVFGMDSLEIQFPMGATAPTSGQVEIWAVELI